MNLCYQKLLAEEELRQRAIGREISPEYAFSLILRATGDIQKAQETKEHLELQRANHDNG